jgi:hypothetical protein
MIDFNSTKQSTNREIVPYLRLLAAIVSQAVQDAAMVSIKSADKKNIREVENNALSALRFLFGQHDDFSTMAGIIGFDAEDMRRALVNGKNSPFGVSSYTDRMRSTIRQRLLKYRFDISNYEDVV